MKKPNIKIVCRLSIISLFVLFFLKLSEISSHANNPEYNVQTILPDNQRDKNKNDFDLKMKAGEKQTIYFYINNTSNSKSDYEISINQAYTNSKGFITYTEKNPEPDETLIHSIDDIVNYESSVSIPAHSSLKYPVQITMPEKEFSGQIIAGINISSKSGDSKSTIDYTIKLTLTENEHEIEKLLNLTSITPVAQSGELKLIVQIQNPTMMAYEDLTYVTRITNSKSNRMIFSETHNSGQQLAPNSHFNLTMNWNTNTINTNKYELDVIVNDGAGNQWLFDETFEINSKEAKELKKEISDYKKYSMYKVLLIVTLILVFIISYFLFFRLTTLKKRKKRRNSARRQAQANRPVVPSEQARIKTNSQENEINKNEPLKRKRKRRRRR